MVYADHDGAVRQVAQEHHVGVVAPENGMILDLRVLNLCTIKSGYNHEKQLHMVRMQLAEYPLR